MIEKCLHLSILHIYTSKFITLIKLSPLKSDGYKIMYSRLYHLIRLFGGINVAEITAKLQASRRSKVLKKFQNGSIDM